MKRLAFALCLLVPAASASAPIEQLWANDAWPACTIEIEFLSACCGIDRNAYQRVVRYVETSKTIKAAFSRPWGAAGETTLCLITGESDGQTRAVFEDLTILVPARARRLPRIPPPPPIVLRLNGGETPPQSR